MSEFDPNRERPENGATPADEAVTASDATRDAPSDGPPDAPLHAGERPMPSAPVASADGVPTLAAQAKARRPDPATAADKAGHAAKTPERRPDGGTGQSNPLAGALWMVLTGVLFVCVTAVVKHVGDAVPAPQTAFLRYALGLILLVPAIRPMMRARIGARGYGLFALRGAAHSIGVMLWFFAMTQISIAEVTAMNYLSPVYVTLLAVVFLGEKLALRRIMAVVVALLGAFVILRPGIREVQAGHLAMLGTALLFALSYLIAKIMSARVEPMVVVTMLSVGVTIGLAPFAWAVWTPPSLAVVGWMFLVACFATAGHLTMTLAFRAAPLTVTQPLTFLQLIWATAIGIIFFGEAADPFVLTGGGMILASVSFITWREAVLKRRQITPGSLQTKV